MNGWKFTWKNILNARGRYLILIAVSACLFAALLVAAGALTATLQREAELRLEYGATARVGLSSCREGFFRRISSSTSAAPLNCAEA